jgi:superoxide dismutase, Cu-Zn family
MGQTRWLIIGTVLFAATGTASGAGEGLKARAELKDAAGKTIGSATLTEEKGGVGIVLKISGLAPGRHGFHIHKNGACDPPDFKTAGGHFNPSAKEHGAKNPRGHHAGDLPNLEVKEDGTAELTVVVPETTLGPGAGSLLKEGATSLVIHAAPDDEMTDPAGNAGARVACGVVGAK